MGRHHAWRVRLIDPIGHGSSGTVWRAWDAHERRYAAAKVVADQPADQPTDPAADPGALPRHPHLLLPYATVRRAGETYALTQLVRGGTADHLLATYGALPASYVAVLLDQLLAALAAVHDAGLAHRDMKPANLLLVPTGRGRPHLFLADLGAAAPLGRRPSTDAGTPGYVPPELAPGNPPDPRHDLYAVGVTAVELLTGRAPRSSRDVPHGPLRPLLCALTDPEPDRRPATTRDATERLRAIGVPAGEPWRTQPHPPDVPDRLRPLTLRETGRARWGRGLRA